MTQPEQPETERDFIILTDVDCNMHSWFQGVKGLVLVTSLGIYGFSQIPYYCAVTNNGKVAIFTEAGGGIKSYIALTRTIRRYNNLYKLGTSPDDLSLQRMTIAEMLICGVNRTTNFGMLRWEQVPSEGVLTTHLNSIIERVNRGS